MEETIAEIEILAQNRSAATSTSMKNPYIIHLPAGDTIGGWNIDFDGWTGNQKKLHSSQWLSQGYDGILFKGMGRGLSRIRPIADDNFFVGPHNAYVAFESCTIGVKSVVGKGKAVHMGLANPTGPILPNFKCILRDVELDAEDQFVWGLFGYQSDWELIDVHFNASMAQGREHNLYAHGFAKDGAYYERVKMDGCGAECLKHTARPGESRWVKDALIHIKSCTFKNWNQPWSWRGGAGFTAQGSSANILIEGSRYYGGATMDKAHCIMLDDSGTDYYSAIDGTPGQGPANGHVIIRNTGGALNGVSQPWNNGICRIGTLQGGTGVHHCARTLLVDNCGFYGENTLFMIGGAGGDSIFGPAAIRNCNTPQVRDIMGALGFKVDVETRIAGPTGVIPMSQGIVIPKN